MLHKNVSDSPVAPFSTTIVVAGETPNAVTRGIFTCTADLIQSARDVQTREGKVARAFVGSEVTAMFNYYILPRVQKAKMPWIVEGSIEPGMAHWGDWRNVCDEHAWRMGLPKSKWLRVHVPMQFSVDHASVHKQLTMHMLRPRVHPLDEYPALERRGLRLLRDRAPHLLQFQTNLLPEDSWVHSLDEGDAQSLQVASPFHERMSVVLRYKSYQVSKRRAALRGTAFQHHSEKRRLNEWDTLVTRLLGTQLDQELAQKLGEVPSFQKRCWLLLLDVKFKTTFMIAKNSQELPLARELIDMVSSSSNGGDHVLGLFLTWPLQ